MKKSLLLFAVLAYTTTAFASSTIEVPALKKLNANEIMIPVGKTGQKISLMQLSAISRGELENMAGRRMNFFERLAFKKTQKKLKKGINRDGVITDKKINNLLKAYTEENDFHIGGFALGFFFTLVGVVVAYQIQDEKKRRRVMWAWMGFGAGLLLLIIFAAAFGTFSVG